jgi:hypothetical protein
VNVNCFPSSARRVGPGPSGVIGRHARAVLGRDRVVCRVVSLGAALAPRSTTSVVCSNTTRHRPQRSMSPARCTGTPDWPPAGGAGQGEMIQYSFMYIAACSGFH